jgi:hypothetical protein
MRTDMTNANLPAVESLQAQIARLEEQLQGLLSEIPLMDDEINAVERDMEALRRKLAEAQ